MEQRFSDVATQPTKTVYHVRLPVMARVQEKSAAASHGSPDKSHEELKNVEPSSVPEGKEELQHLNLFLNIDKGENFGQVLQQMAHMEGLENTFDTQSISQVMQLMDTMTRCDKWSKTDKTQKQPAQRGPQQPNAQQTQQEKVLPNWHVGALESKIPSDNAFMAQLAQLNFRTKPENEKQEESSQGKHGSPTKTQPKPQRMKIVNGPETHSQSTGSNMNADTNDDLLGAIGIKRKNLERMWQIFMQKAPDEWIQL